MSPEKTWGYVLPPWSTKCRVRTSGLPGILKLIRIRLLIYPSSRYQKKTSGWTEAGMESLKGVSGTTMWIRKWRSWPAPGVAFVLWSGEARMPNGSTTSPTGLQCSPCLRMIRRSRQSLKLIPLCFIMWICTLPHPTMHSDLPVI